MHPGVRHHQPGRLLRPRIGQVQETLPGEEISLHDFTPASTLGLSRGCLTRAGSVTKPRAWAYSSHSRVSRGVTASAFATTGLMLSGTRTRKTPPKNSQASSQPAMTSSSVIENVRYTNRYREKHAVNTSACSLRRRPSPAGISPRYPKSTCSSPPGGPSSTGVVTLLPPAPHRSAANRCSVRSATTTPCRASKIPIFTTGTPALTHAVISSWRASSSAHPAPCPSGAPAGPPTRPARSAHR